MAGAAFLYQRLWLYTGDPHDAEIARLLMNTPRQFVDVGGSLGYRYPGLRTEAVTFAPARGSGVDTWLPWLTLSVVEQIVRTEETFGRGALTATPDQTAVLEAQNEAFGRSRGFGSPAK